MEFNRCLGCMKEKTQPVCEHCGWDENSQNQPHQLPTGTILKGQYMIGRVLGQGGFGITYLGWDMYLEVPVAIKEYYPSSFVTRNSTAGLKVTGFSQEANDAYEKNKERFLKEAQILECCSGIPEVVKIRNFFPDNNTVYIVMEYLQGRNLKDHLRRLGRGMTMDETLGILRPLLGGLQKVHEAGLIHRDISPDNIMIQPGGKVKLLDLGSVWTSHHAGSETQNPFKNGFTPLEQYQSKSNLGPWSDVYALCATMVYCMTGKTPTDSPTRLDSDDLDGVLRSIPGLKEHQRKALERGMALKSQDRIQSVRELEEQLTDASAQAGGAAAVPAPAQQPSGQAAGEKTGRSSRKKERPVAGEKKPGKRKLWIGAAAAAAVVALVLMLGFYLVDNAPAVRTEDNTLDLTVLEENGVEKNEIERIEFLEQGTEAAEAVAGTRFDLSASGAGAVEACLDGVDLYILCDGPVYAPVDSSHLFGIPDPDLEQDKDYFENLREIRFNGLFSTAGVKIMHGMFQHCSALEALDLSGFDTTQTINMEFMFNGCQALQQLDLSSFDTGQVRMMMAMFQNCEQLTELDVSSFDTAAATQMDYMFNGCKQLEQLDLKSFDTAKVEDMTAMFQNCRMLRSVELAGFNTAQVQSMAGMFHRCGALTGLSLTNFDTSNVTDMQAMFDGCTDLTELDLSSFDTAKVTDMSGMFQSCESIERLDLSHFETDGVLYMWAMFKDCLSMKYLDVSGFHTEQVENMEDMFRSVPADCEVRAGEDDNLRMYLVYIGFL